MEKRIKEEKEEEEEQRRCGLHTSENNIVWHIERDVRGEGGLIYVCMDIRY